MRQYDNETIRQWDSTTMKQYDNETVRQWDNTTMRQYDNETVWKWDSMSKRHYIETVCNGAISPLWLEVKHVRPIFNLKGWGEESS